MVLHLCRRFISNPSVSSSCMRYHMRRLYVCSMLAPTRPFVFSSHQNIRTLRTHSSSGIKLTQFQPGLRPQFSDYVIYASYKPCLRIFHSSTSWSSKKIHKHINDTDTKEEEELEHTDDKIQLFDSSDKFIGVMTRSKAQLRADKNNLKLVKLTGPKMSSSYQLLSGAELMKAKMKEKLDKSAPKKSEKVYVLKSNISDHDLQIKVKQMADYLKKGVPVKIQVRLKKQRMGNTDPKIEVETTQRLTQIFKSISEHIKDVAVMQKSVMSASEFSVILKPKESDSNVH